MTIFNYPISKKHLIFNIILFMIDITNDYNLNKKNFIFFEKEDL